MGKKKGSKAQTGQRGAAVSEITTVAIDHAASARNATCCASTAAAAAPVVRPHHPRRPQLCFGTHPLVHLLCSAAQVGSSCNSAVSSDPQDDSQLQQRAELVSTRLEQLPCSHREQRCTPCLVIGLPPQCVPLCCVPKDDME